MDQVSRALLMAGGAAEATDSQFSGVTMLLPGNGTNGAQNNTFVDASTNNFSITRNGNTTQGTFTPYGANWSNYFDGTGDYLQTPSNAAFAFGTGDYTIEFFCNMQFVPSGASAIFGIPFGGGDGLYAYLNGAGRIVVYQGNIGNIQSTSTGYQGTWVHVAICRSAGTLNVFFDGISPQSYSDSRDWGSSNYLEIGRNTSNFSNFGSGYVSNLRVLKGTALYTAAFTPPTAPLTAIANTSLLTCQSNRFIDNSANAFTITVNGDTSVQRFSPFSPTAAYSTSVVGGSGYFDGSGDQLVAPNNSAFAFGTGDFTLEAWFYSTSSGDRTILTNLVSSPDADNALLLFANASGGITVSTWNTLLYQSSNNIVVRSQWNHIALCRSGTTEAVWLNGTRLSSWTDTFNYSQTNGYRVGAFGTTSYPFTGYISNSRVIKGTAFYNPSSTTITVPTSPFTDVTNTSLLLNYTNAGVIDNAMMNNLETVGNAQISTTQSKWGGSSMYFDGTGDNLLAKTNQIYSFGTGDFTVELWVYTGSTVNMTLVDARPSGTAEPWALYTTATTSYPYFYDGSSYTSSVALTLNSWNHVAVSRSSGTLRVFVNGTQGFSGTVSTNLTSGDLKIGGAFGGSYFTGYIDDLRITKGYARYTANFTPPDSLPRR